MSTSITCKSTAAWRQVATHKALWNKRISFGGQILEKSKIENYFNLQKIIAQKVFVRERSGWRHWKENYQNQFEHEFRPESHTVGPVSQLPHKKRGNPISLGCRKKVEDILRLFSDYMDHVSYKQAFFVERTSKKLQNEHKLLTF